MPRRQKRLWFLVALGALLLGTALSFLFFLSMPRTSAVLPAVTATRPAPIIALTPAAPPSLTGSPPLPLVASATPISSTLPPAPDSFAGDAITHDLVETTQSITIDDNYALPHNVRRIQYTFQRTATGFAGQGTLMAPSYPLGITYAMAVPAADGTRVLQLLATAIREGESVELNPDTTSPVYEETVTIALRSSSGSTRFFMPAVPERWGGHKTWRVTYAGQRFETFSYAVFAAYDLLKQHLSPDLFTR